jgi:hypothetical protein
MSLWQQEKITALKSGCVPGGPAGLYFFFFDGFGFGGPVFDGSELETDFLFFFVNDSFIELTVTAGIYSSGDAGILPISRVTDLPAHSPCGDAAVGAVMFHGCRYGALAQHIRQ